MYVLSASRPKNMIWISSINVRKHKFADNNEIICQGEKFVLLKTIENVSLN